MRECLDSVLTIGELDSSNRDMLEEHVFTEPRHYEVCWGLFKYTCIGAVYQHRFFGPRLYICYFLKSIGAYSKASLAYRQAW